MSTTADAARVPRAKLAIASERVIIQRLPSRSPVNSPLMLFQSFCLQKRSGSVPVSLLVDCRDAIAPLT